MKICNLINLDTTGGVERLYLSWLQNTPDIQNVTITDRRTIHPYFKDQVHHHTPVYFFRHALSVKIPRFFSNWKLKRILKQENPDILLIWNKLGDTRINHLSDNIKKVYFEHGGAWITSDTLKHPDFFKNIDQIVCISHAAQRMLTHRYSETMNIDTTVIHNPVSIPPNTDFSKTSFTKTRFGIAARQIPRKGTPIAIKALSIVLNEGHKAELYIAGDGDSKSDFQVYAAKLGISDHVSWLGNLNDMSDFYQNIDIILCPSTQEPFGLTVLEAFSYGVKAIVANIDGLAEAGSISSAIKVNPTVSMSDYAKEYNLDFERLDTESFFPDSNEIKPSLALDSETLAKNMIDIIDAKDTSASIHQNMRKRPELSDASWANKILTTIAVDP